MFLLTYTYHEEELHYGGRRVALSILLVEQTLTS